MGSFPHPTFYQRDESVDKLIVYKHPHLYKIHSDMHQRYYFK